MPTYEYHCRKCGKNFDVLQSMKDKPLTKCVKCKSGKVDRLISAGAGLIFKGSGFYITDYKKPSQPSKDSQSQAKPETKPEAKPEKKESKKSGDEK